ncbi:MULTISPECIES: metal-dependent transcriptional regulator [Helcococcus]|uniref:Metal-dependent transcriptional regulator n=1 Tax=Helcococcus bovis TaxID=3153252 RepID=A0ABW9F423_9FIRM
MEVNSQREDYLTTIFKLNRTGGGATNKSISEWLDVSPASVTEMIKKLRVDGLVIDSKKIELTDAGEKIAKDILSKHRLWETFLQTTLDLDWKDVHEHAKKLQSVTDDILFNRLNKFLGFPDYCPHGSIIYLNSEESNHDLIQLSKAEPNTEYRIRRIRDNRDLLNYAEKLGLKIGDKIFVEEFDAFDDTVVVNISGNTVRISPKASVDIYLKK